MLTSIHHELSPSSQEVSEPVNAVWTRCCVTCRASGSDRRISRRSSLTDDRVDEVINNLTNMHSMVKLLREGSVDKPDASRTWDVRRYGMSPMQACLLAYF